MEIDLTRWLRRRRSPGKRYICAMGGSGNHATEERIAPYLPDNYRIVFGNQGFQGFSVIAGTDVEGATLEDVCRDLAELTEAFEISEQAAADLYE